MAGDQFMSLYSGIDIFIEKLVRKRADGADIKFNSMHDLSDALEREVKREKPDEGIDSDEDGGGDLS
jgi:hypothetical protein